MLMKSTPIVTAFIVSRGVIPNWDDVAHESAMKRF